MRKEPHGPVGLGSLSLQELSQQPLHLPVSGVGTLHRLLRVKTIKRTRYLSQQYKVLLDTEGKREKPQISICWKHKIGTSSDSAIMWRTTKMSVGCSKASENLSPKESQRRDAVRCWK